MILIISEDGDHSSSEVIQWLNYYRAKFVRINRGDRLILQNIQISEDKGCDFVFISKERGEINLKEIRAIWYRRGEMYFQIPKLDFIKNVDLRNQIFQHLNKENKIIQDYLEYLLLSIPHIGTFEFRGVNKLVVLDQARKLGIEIPETFIVSKQKHLKSTDNLITKCISEVFTPKLSEGKFITYTEAVSYKNRKVSFFPSLFQTLVEKEADIRIFILQDKVFSMAIRSQSHVQTRIDFRKYLPTNPSRLFTFKLPTELKQKLIKLMNEIKLETASIDMVLTKDGRFVFLEANPVGQFGMTSIPCNNYLEREIALSLINLSKHHAV